MRTIRSARSSIGAKIAALVGALLLVLVATNAALFFELTQATAKYEHLLAGPTRQAQQARVMQVEFKKQVQEWKDILLRGANPTDRVTYTTQFRAEYAKVNALADGLLAGVDDPQARNLVSQFTDAHTTLQQHYEQALSGFLASGGVDFHSADTLVRGQDRPPTALVDGIVQRLQTVVDGQVAAQQAAVRDRERLLLGLGLAGVAALSVLLALVVRRIVGPIRRLTSWAYTAAGVTLPAAVDAIKTMPADAEAPAVPPFPQETQDELGELAAALNTMQARAVSLALEQHRRDRETDEMLLNLGRRNQTLLARVLSYVTTLERSEQDPDVVAELFRIDHATTRVRRNAASMLVLAGAPPSPSRARAAVVGDVVRAALSEIEDYPRVDVHHLEPAAISGAGAADLSHLLAELIENATQFSPPATRVTVVGQRVVDGYRIRVIDQGIGMTHDELVAANARVADASSGHSDARLLGLYVVGRLADRHGIRTVLEASAGLGITATVVVPQSLLTELPSRPDPLPVPLPAAAPTPVPPLRAGQLAAHVSAPLTAPATAQIVAQGSAREPEPARGAEPARGPELVPVPRVIQLPEPSRMAVPAYRDPAALLPGDTLPGEFGPPAAVPTRVRGSQLARLGWADDQPVVRFAPPPESSSDRLRTFQLDVEAARQAVGRELAAPTGTTDPRALPGAGRPEEDHG